MVRPEGIVSLKNPVTPPGVDPGTVRLVGQRLNHYATPDPFVLSISYHYFFRWFTQDAFCMVFGAVTGWSSIRRIGSLLRAALGAEVSVSMLTSGGRDCHGLRPRGVPWRPACSALQLHRGVLQPTVGWSPGPPHTGLHSIILAPTVPRLFRQLPEETH